MKKRQQNGRSKTAKLAGAIKDTADRLSMGVTFKCKYIGSLDVPKPCSRQEIISDMRRIRREFRTRKIKKAKVAVMVSTSGIKAALRSHRYKKSYSWTWDIQGLVILDNPIQRVFYVAHDSQDLKIFSYISRDPGTNTFKCNVFKTYRRADAERIVRMIGQAFGSRSATNVKEDDAPPPAALEGSAPTAATKDDAETEAQSLNSPAPPKPPRQLLDGSVPLSVSHELQLLRQHLQLQEQHGQAALARAQLLKDQLRAETQARMEAQARVHQLLLHNRDLLDHINQLIQTLKELESQVYSTGPVDATIPNESNVLIAGRFPLEQAPQAGPYATPPGECYEPSRVPIAGSLASNSAKHPAERPSVADDEAKSFLCKESVKFAQEAQGNKIAEQQGVSANFSALKEPKECMINTAFVEDDPPTAGSLLPAGWNQPAAMTAAAVGSWSQHAPQRSDQPYARLRPPSVMSAHSAHGVLNGSNLQHNGAPFIHNQDMMTSTQILPSSSTAPTGGKEPHGPPAATDPSIQQPRITGVSAVADTARIDQQADGAVATAEFISDSVTSRLQLIQGRDLAALQAYSGSPTARLPVPAKTREETSSARTTVISGQNSEDNISKIATDAIRQPPSGTPNHEETISTPPDASKNIAASSFWRHEGASRASAPSQRHATVLPYAWSRISAPERISRTKSLLRRHRDDWQCHLELIREHSSVSSESSGAPNGRCVGGEHSETVDTPQSSDSRPFRWSVIEGDQPSAENFSLLTGSKTSTMDSLMAINFLRKNL